MGVDRYLRQTVLPEIGKAGQEKLAVSRVLCVGIGGLGSPAALYLAAAGVGRIGLMDPDRVDESNLQRQVLFQEIHQEKFKVFCAKEQLQRLNSSVQIDAIPERLTAGNALGIFTEYDVIVDGTDNFPTKYLINDAAVRAGRPVIYGSISRMEGQLSVFGAMDGPCYRCLYPAEPKTWIPNCAESGVLGAVAGVVGSMQAIEAMKIILGLPALIGQLLVWDAFTMRSRTVALTRRPSCPACSISRDQVRLSDSQIHCQISEKFREISVSELQKLLLEGKLQLIDVREPHEWRSGCLPGARGLPLSEMMTQLNAELNPREPLPLDPSRTTVFYCQSGTRSRIAMETLLRSDSRFLGTLSHLKGGLALWPYELSQHALPEWPE